jgi:hypothetical protein
VVYLSWSVYNSFYRNMSAFKLHTPTKKKRSHFLSANNDDDDGYNTEDPISPEQDVPPAPFRRLKRASTLLFRLSESCADPIFDTPHPKVALDWNEMPPPLPSPPRADRTVHRFRAHGDQLRSDARTLRLGYPVGAVYVLFPRESPSALPEEEREELTLEDLKPWGKRPEMNTIWWHIYKWIQQCAYCDKYYPLSDFHMITKLDEIPANYRVWYCEEKKIKNEEKVYREDDYDYQLASGTEYSTHWLYYLRSSHCDRCVAYCYEFKINGTVVLYD